MRTLPVLTLCAILAGCALPLARPAAGEAAVQRYVGEDDQVRITELRVRGLTQRIGVEPKDSAAPRYEITPQGAGSDPSGAKTGAGQRVWTVLSF